MCMQMAISRRELIGIGVLAVVLSPFLIVGGIGFGIGKGIYTAGKAIHDVGHAAKERRRLARWERESVQAALHPVYAPPELGSNPDDLEGGSPHSPKDAFDPELVKALQQLYDTAMEKKDAASYIALGAGMFFQEDFGAAFYFLGLGTADTTTGAKQLTAEQQVYALYYKGLAAQHLAHFTEAVAAFEAIRTLLPSIPKAQQAQAPVTGEGDEATPAPVDETAPLEAADVTAALAYNLYLNTLYPPRDTTPDEKDFLRAQALIAEAIAMRSTEARFYAMQAFIEFRLFFVKRRSKPPPLEVDLENTLKQCEMSIGKALKIVAPVPPRTKGHWYTTLLQEGSEWEPIDPTLTAEMLSLRAHCRLALYKQFSHRNTESFKEIYDYAMKLRDDCQLDLQAALVLDSGVPQGGMKPGQTIEALGFRWPLPEDAASGVKAQKHDFEQLHFKKPTYCDSCLEFVTFSQNVSDGGYRCKNCRFECHVQCLQDSLLKPCYKAKKQAEPGHHHVLKLRKIHRCRDCVHCNEFIMMMTDAYQCKGCNSYMHKKCGALVLGAIFEDHEH